MKRALITGITGQDGSYLADLLLSKGYMVFGIIRKKADLKYVPKGVKLLYGDLDKFGSLISAVKKSIPDEVYNLGGISDLKTAYADPDRTMRINYSAVGILQREALKINKNVRFLQASSSEIFLPSKSALNENSRRDWNTKNPYALAKMMADRDFIKAAREKHGMFAVSAILFTHDSPRRRFNGAMRKFVSMLVKIKSGKEKKLLLGNIDAKRDWGFAGDYTFAMWKMLQVKKPEDIVIASGNSHSVKAIIDTVSKLLGINLMWHGKGVEAFATDKNGDRIVEAAIEFFKPIEKYVKIGNIGKAKKVLGWYPKTKFKKLIRLMVTEELQTYSESV